MIEKLALTAAALASCVSAVSARELQLPKSVPVRAVTPVFSQLVAFSYPGGFSPAFEDRKGGQYIQESVPSGESVESWSQMLTLTGAKDLARNRPELTPAMFGGSIASDYRNACPETFSSRELGLTVIDSRAALVAVVSCGSVAGVQPPRSEAMLLIVIRGERDYYTLQWAERGRASAKPQDIDTGKWNERLARLSPIVLCQSVEGESSPISSCRRP